MPAPIVMHPPSPSGGRRVTVNGRLLGLAHGLQDLAEFLRQLDLDTDNLRFDDPELIEWRRGGPDV